MTTGRINQICDTPSYHRRSLRAWRTLAASAVRFRRPPQWGRTTGNLVGRRAHPDLRRSTTLPSRSTLLLPSGWQRLRPSYGACFRRTASDGLGSFRWPVKWLATRYLSSDLSSDATVVVLETPRDVGERRGPSSFRICCTRQYNEITS